MRASRSFAAIAATRTLPLNLTEGETAERIEGARVTDGLPAVLGVGPLLGRAFTPEETAPAGPAVTILSDAFWRRRFGGERSVIGRTIGLDGRRFLVVGVLPPRLSYPNPDTDVWIPMQKLKPEEDRGRNFVRVVGRLRSGVPSSQAGAEIATIGRRLERQYPATNQGTRFYLTPVRDELVGGARKALWILQGAAGVLLGIACVNVANLLLVRAAGRRNELAIRAALGAGRRRLAGQFLTESLLLGVFGGALGIALAAAATAFLKRLPAALLPRAHELALDGRVLAFGIMVSAATALAFGVVPALRGTGRGIGELSRAAEEGRAAAAPTSGSSGRSSSARSRSRSFSRRERGFCSEATSFLPGSTRGSRRTVSGRRPSAWPRRDTRHPRSRSAITARRSAGSRPCGASGARPSSRGFRSSASGHRAPSPSRGGPSRTGASRTPTS